MVVKRALVGLLDAFYRIYYFRAPRQGPQSGLFRLLGLLYMMAIYLVSIEFLPYLLAFLGVFLSVDVGYNLLFGSDSRSPSQGLARFVYVVYRWHHQNFEYVVFGPQAGRWGWLPNVFSIFNASAFRKEFSDSGRRDDDDNGGPTPFDE